MNFHFTDLRHAQVVTDGFGRQSIMFAGRTFDFRAPDDVNNVMVGAMVQALHSMPEDNPEQSEGE